MRQRMRWWLVSLMAACTAAIGVFACTNSYLYDQRRETEVAADRTLTLRGQFCAPAPSQVLRPIKIVIAMDASQSMAISDPSGSRALATVALLDNLPQEPEVEFVVMLFAGSTTAWLSKTGLNQFERVVDYSQSDKDLLRQRILNFTVVGTMANRDSTDFVKPLNDIYALINKDIAEARLQMASEDARARYSVIFLSDGQPTVNQDRELICNEPNELTKLRNLKDLADDVRVNTVHVFKPTQRIDSSACNVDGGISIPVGGSSCELPDLPPGSCPLLIISQNVERLSRMAAFGGGNFRDFRNNEPVNFLNFNFGQVRRSFVFDTLVVSNLSAPAGSPEGVADTDSDGLLDADELTEGTLPWVADTDGDGFSDGVEVYFRSRGGRFTPNQMPLPDGGGVDPGCPPELRGVDSDCDTLTDCDEQMIGTNARRIDSDDDGISDAVEFKLGSQPASKDLSQDPDSDGLSTGDELLMHMNPSVVDSASLTTTGYRYEIEKSGGLSADGEQCWNFRVSNVLLANTMPDTRDAGNPDGGADLFRRGAGYNDVLVTLSMRAGDDPSARSAIRMWRHTQSRYPVGGIRSPHDGVLEISSDAFQSTCAAAVSP